MSLEPIDIANPLVELCHRLGLKPQNVACLVIFPRKVEATVYLLKDGNEKYLRHDGEPATAVQRFEVST